MNQKAFAALLTAILLNGTTGSAYEADDHAISKALGVAKKILSKVDADPDLEG